MSQRLLVAVFWMGLTGPLLAQNPPGTPLPPGPTIAPNPPPTQPDALPLHPHGPDGKKPPFGGGGPFEMEIRQKMEMLSQLTPQQLDTELQKWPRYQKMDLGERGKLLQRLQEYKERRHKIAENRAHDLGLKLTPDQAAAFEKKFWEKKLKADLQLFQEMEPRRKALDAQVNTELKQEFAKEMAAPAPVKPTVAPVSTPAPPATTTTSK